MSIASIASKLPELPARLVQLVAYQPIDKAVVHDDPEAVKLKFRDTLVATNTPLGA